MKPLLKLFVLGAVALVVGCNEENKLTKEQEDALKNKPTAPANYKGPDKAGLDKMSQEIQDYNEKHKNDKVEFKTGN